MDILLCFVLSMTFFIFFFLMFVFFVFFFLFFFFFFFFQAEDGIRDGHVTGVQTCALPICLVHRHWSSPRSVRRSSPPGSVRRWCTRRSWPRSTALDTSPTSAGPRSGRS